MKKGSMALEMIGKWVIILVVVFVAIGLITVFRSKIQDAIKGLSGNNKDDPVYVKIGLANPSLELSKITELISLCYDSRKGRSSDDTCYIVHNKNGDFSMTANEIKERLPGGMQDKMIFKNQKFDTETIVISYMWVDEKIVLEQ